MSKFLVSLWQIAFTFGVTISLYNFIALLTDKAETVLRQDVKFSDKIHLVIPRQNKSHNHKLHGNRVEIKSRELTLLTMVPIF